MVTGGAAGQSGLAYSMRAGTICGSVAGEAVAAGDVSRGSLSQYEKLWKREFYWQYRMGRASLRTLAMMKDEEIDPATGWNEHYVGFNGDFCSKLFHEGFFQTKKPVLYVGFQESLLKLFFEIIQLVKEEKTGHQQMGAAHTILMLSTILSVTRNQEFAGKTVEHTIISFMIPYISRGKCFLPQFFLLRTWLK